MWSISKDRCFLWAILAYTAAVCLVFLSITGASAQDRVEHEGRGPGGGHRGYGPPPERYGGPPERHGGLAERGYEQPTTATAKGGYLFVDGEYLTPPYEISLEDERLLVNGREMKCVPPQRSYGGRGYGGLREPSRRWSVGELYGYLHNNNVVMSFANQPFLVLDTNSAYDLFKSLTAMEQRSLRQVSVMEKLPDEFERQVWDDWISRFVPPDNLKVRAVAFVASFDATQREALANIRARRLMETLAYPLSVAGMVMSVLAIGHLLGGRPHAGKSAFGLDPSPEMIKALNWSLLFAAVFSSIDLILTILGANADQIRELNPIGNLWIEDPRHLAGFKVGVTFSCLALLWLLRKYKRAQIAAWWVCLVLTLVTCRWVLMTSLFVTA
jgi:hypothetical protein